MLRRCPATPPSRRTTVGFKANTAPSAGFSGTLWQVEWARCLFLVARCRAPPLYAPIRVPPSHELPPRHALPQASSSASATASTPTSGTPPVRSFLARFDNRLVGLSRLTYRSKCDGIDPDIWDPSGAQCCYGSPLVSQAVWTSSAVVLMHHARAPAVHAAHALSLHTLTGPAAASAWATQPSRTRPTPFQSTAETCLHANYLSLQRTRCYRWATPRGVACMLVPSDHLG